MRNRFVVIVVVVAIGVVVLDQLTKAWAVARLAPPDGAPIEVIGTFLRFLYVENTGAAFGIGTAYTWVFTIIAATVAVVILRTARKLGSVPWAIALGGLLGGAVGNLIDRLTREPSFGQGYVVDFIALPYFAVFNIADMAITISAVAMVVLSLMGVEFGGKQPAPANADE